MSAISMRTVSPRAIPMWTRVVATRDGSGERGDLALKSARTPCADSVNESAGTPSGGRAVTRTSVAREICTESRIRRGSAKRMMLRATGMPPTASVESSVVSTEGESRSNTKLSNRSPVDADRGTVPFPSESTSANQVIRGPSPDSTDPRAMLARELAAVGRDERRHRRIELRDHRHLVRGRVHEHAVPPQRINVAGERVHAVRVERAERVGPRPETAERGGRVDAEGQTVIDQREVVSGRVAPRDREGELERVHA